MAKNESKILNESLDAYTNPDIKKNLEDLRRLWIDPELFAKFEERIKRIIWENPWSEDLVIWELWKTQISIENLLANYNREFRSILDRAADNNLFIDPI